MTRPLVRTALALIAALSMAACTVPVRSDATATSVSASALDVVTSAAPAPTMVVTVPALGGESASATTSVSAVLAPTPVSTRTATVTAGSATRRTSQQSTAAAPSTSAALSTTPAATVAVELANCAGCTVLATHRSVVGDLSAALVRSGQGRGVLVSLRPDGSVGSVANVLYGVTFSAPAAGALPCDAAGRCVVIAQQASGKAIASAWALSAAGGWKDVSVPGGFVSATGAAQAVDLDGDTGIAVQEQGGGTTIWTVFGWASDGYVVVGCATAAGPLDASRLSTDRCLS